MYISQHILLLTNIGSTVNLPYERSGVTSGCVYQLITTCCLGTYIQTLDPRILVLYATREWGSVSNVTCDNWYHRTCINMSHSELETLGQNETDLLCSSCTVLSALYFEDVSNDTMPILYEMKIRKWKNMLGSHHLQVTYHPV